jgi:hypothetical protein
MKLKRGCLEAVQEKSGIWRVRDNGTKLEMYAPSRKWVELLFARAEQYRQD